jgi:hypothetical protein
MVPEVVEECTVVDGWQRFERALVVVIISLPYFGFWG